MAAGQLWLFPPPKPLVKRLGDDFFRALPSGPGVYFMACAGSAETWIAGTERAFLVSVQAFHLPVES